MLLVFGLLFFAYVTWIVFFPDSFANAKRALGIDTGPDISRNGSGMNYDGIDVSHHQGQIDWDIVAADTSIRFVYIKASEGSTLRDSLYLYNQQEARRVGIRVGSYHYLTDTSPIRSQYVNFATFAVPEDQDLIPMIDVERDGVGRWSRQQLQDSLALFLYFVKKHYGRYPFIYADRNFYNSHLSPRFDKLPLFIARYDEHFPYIKGAHRHFLWQHTDQGSIAGIPTLVDLDVMAGGIRVEDFMLR